MRRSRLVPNQIVTAALSPVYSLGDVYGSVGGARFSVEAMLDDLDCVDLSEQAPKLKVPIDIFQGRHDYATPWPLAEHYFGALEAPRGKELVWFEHSAHALRAKEPEKFGVEKLRVLRETYPRGSQPE
jgi:pimeloyl-ACP methyl ester carboxylesterase